MAQIDFKNWKGQLTVYNRIVT